MTAPECPVCATPHEPGAATCAFCGVSLREAPEALRPAPESATEAEPRVEDAPPPADVSEPETVDVATDATATDEATADETRSDDAAPAEPAADEPATDGAAPDQPAADVPGAPAPAAADADAADADATPTDPSGPEAMGEPGPADIPATAVPAVAPSGRTRTPSFVRTRTAAGSARQRARRIEWSVVAGLAALLLVQVVASDFDQLAGNAATRPWLQHACALLRCTLPAWREPQALRLLQRDVRANPARPGLLRISASFRNEARWAQPWPRLRVVLSDADGRTIAARDFAANEYLGATPTANGIASGQVAGVAVDVVDPSPRVTAFTFEFR